LGGYVVPFLSKPDGSPYFVVPKGVTSISLDCHKYGLAGKGSSVLLFSSEEYRQNHIFAPSEWPGGYSRISGFTGGRSGVSVASAWISMMKLGSNGYKKHAKNVSNGNITS
jgi:sphinganine-1-phosphate aldolase